MPGVPLAFFSIPMDTIKSLDSPPPEMQVQIPAPPLLFGRMKTFDGRREVACLSVVLYYDSLRRGDPPAQ
jgi:hypothetical protein